LHYQVQVDHTGRPFGAEALLRWQHPQRGFISPLQFIPVAESSGLIIDIGMWVLDQACAQIAQWQHARNTSDLSLSVNISARQFRQANFISMIKACIQKHQINPNALRLELTESLLLENVDDAVSIMTELSHIGIQFSLDDFGTGYSSLQYLKKLPLYQLKIDRSFVNDIVTDSHDRTIVRTIIAMAQSMYLSVIAEGVETQEQMELLLNNGCRRYQGYLFGKPMPIAQFEACLTQTLQ
jgi:EAL domain-containing protein (putative c-di-GMP-specific phosphodiesterase class I)